MPVVESGGGAGEALRGRASLLQQGVAAEGGTCNEGHASEAASGCCYAVFMERIRLCRQLG